ncbi:MAG: hypothetical protein Q9168_004110 [Polycauliona sp. 1 TL-2023]
MELQNHHRVTGHCYCRECDKSFGCKSELKEHRRRVHEHPCGQCTLVFDSAARLCAHQRKTNHCYCQECDRCFSDQQAHSQHLRSAIHVSQFRCLECERDFSSEQALGQHLKDKKDHGPPERSITTVEDRIHECTECDRQFPNRDALEQHLTSVIHRPLSNLKCIASSKCRARFTSPSALLHHLESGFCRSKLTRASLNQLIQGHDAESMITFGALVQQPPDSVDEDEISTELFISGIVTPSSRASDTYSGLGGAPLGLSTFSGPEKSSVSQTGKLLCPMCPATSRGFRTMEALESHFDSPAHAPKVFHCPTNLTGSNKKGKRTEPLIKDFSTLSGLTQHVESGACDGGKQMLEEAMKFVSGMLKNLGFKEIKLLE